jgi:hypothetical protein
MNDAADESSKPTSAEPEYRKLSDEELRLILEKHEQWLAAEDKTGLDHLRADLPRAELRKWDLRGAQLQGPTSPGPNCRGPPSQRGQHWRRRSPARYDQWTVMHSR